MTCAAADRKQVRNERAKLLPLVIAPTTTLASIKKGTLSSCFFGTPEDPIECKQESMGFQHS